MAGKRKKRGARRLAQPDAERAAAALAQQAAAEAGQLAAPAGSGKAKRIWREAAASEPIDNGFHTYKADPLDHAETDTRAYEHLRPLLLLLARHLSKKPADLALWDPYFCKGAMVRRLAGLGFHKVHNVNEDFYAVIESGRLPEHDLILSSPPYSGDHLERCLKFCGSSRSAWALLLPNWVQSRPYFRESLGSKFEQVFYISPVDRYTYWMPPDLVRGRSRPEWVGDDGGTSPYDSSWYVYLPPRAPRKKICAALEKHESSRVHWVLAETLKAARWKVKKLTGRRRAPQGAGQRGEPEGAPQHGPKPRGKKRKSLDAEAPPAAAPAAPGKRQKHAKWGNTISFD